MTETLAEVLILVINALGAGILLMVSGVIQRIMNDMDPPVFKKFLNTLVGTAMSDPFAVTIATIPIILVIFYFVAYGFGHWWFTAGIVVWMTASVATKVTNMPIYKWVGDPKNTDPEELRKKRHTLELGNNWRAWLTLVSVILMACQFGATAVAIVAAACALITYPSLWLPRKYMPK